MEGNNCATNLLVVVITAACFFGSAEAKAGDPKIPSEARRKWADYMEFAKHIQGNSSHVFTDRLAGNKVISRSRDEIKIRGFAMAVSFQEFGPGPPEPEQLWYVRNERYGFELRRKTNADAWVVAQFHQDIGDGTKVLLSRSLNEKTPRRFTGLWIYGQWLPQISEDKEFRVKKYAKVNKGGLELARVEFEYPKAKQRSWRMESGWFLLDPSRYWLVREYEVNVTWGGGDAGTVRYTADFKVGESGKPLLSKTLQHTDCPGEKTNVDRTTEYNLHEREPLAEEFRLTAFGLPEPKGIIWPSSPSRWWLWFIGIAVVSLGLAAYLRRRAQANNIDVAPNNPSVTNRGSKP